MKVFIIHSGIDKPVAELYKTLISKETESEVLVLNNGGPLWKRDASKLIKQANIALFLVGSSSHKSPNIGWEIKRCIKFNKPVYFLNLKSVHEALDGNYENNEDNLKKLLSVISNKEDKYEDHPSLKEMNKFTKEFQFRFLVKEINNISELITRITRYNNNEYDLFNVSVEQMNEDELIEQYKIYLGTSESLINRRQNVSSFYISVNAAIISILTLVSPFITNIVSNAIAIIVVSLFGIILDIAWMRILDSYAILNSSKLKVIEMIEKRLPASIYDIEWAVMSNKLNNRRYISFTDSEKRIPKVFCAIYIIAILVFVTLLVLKLANVF